MTVEMPTGRTEGRAAGAPGEWRRVSLPDFGAPFLAALAGQLLVGAGEGSRAWGWAVILGAIVLLGLRLRRGVPSALADALQIGLAVAVCLQLSLNLNGIKQHAAPATLILIWALGASLAVLAVLNFKPQRLDLGLPAFRLDRWDALVLGLLLLAAVVTRVPALDRVPLGFDPDEGSFAIFAADAAMGAARDPFATGWATHPTLQFFFNAPLVQVLGRSGWAMRLPSAIMGILAAAAIYLFARAGYGRRVAVIAGVLAVASDVLIQFSRLGVNNISDTLFMAWTVAALWIAASTGRPAAWAAAGVGLGLGQYYYFGARAIPFVVGATLLVWLLADRRGLLRSWRLVLGFGLVTLVVAGPLLGHWLRTPGSVSEHMFLTAPFSAGIAEQAAKFNTTPMGVWGRHVTQSLGVFTVVPDVGSFYHPERPLLDALQGPFFLLGLGSMLIAIRRPIHQAVLLSLGVVLLLGSVLMNDPAAFHRLLGLMPFVIVIVALGVDTLATLAVSVLKGCEDPVRARRVRLLLSGVIVALMALATLNFYFRTYPDTLAYKPPNQVAVSIAALEIAAGKQGAVFLCTVDGVDGAGKVYHTPLVYAGGDRVKGCTPELIGQAADSLQDLTFYFLTDQFGMEENIAAQFPGGTFADYHRPNDGLLIMSRYTVLRNAATQQ